VTFLSDVFLSITNKSNLSTFSSLAKAVENAGSGGKNNPFKISISKIVIHELISSSDWDFTATGKQFTAIDPQYRVLRVNGKCEVVSGLVSKSLDSFTY
jgi:hypothetical protein